MQFNHRLWGEIVPDGPDFCHWGGRGQSQHLVQLLDAGPEDHVLEICCGQGGMLQLISGPAMVCGVELSTQAALCACRKGLDVVQADARTLPFADGAFTRVLSQDADAWMHEKHQLACELRRVVGGGAKLVLQTYARSARMGSEQIEEVRHILAKCGYTAYALPVAEHLAGVLETAGWAVTHSVSLHALYAVDNGRMLRKLARNYERLESLYGAASVSVLEALLTLEKSLFAKHFWTGLLIIAQAKPLKHPFL